MTTTHTPSACPHCAAKYQSGKEYFECKSGVREGNGAYRTDLCREREARQKAEAELAKTNETLAIVWTDFEEMMPLKKKAEAELAELWSRFDNQMQAEAEVDKMKAVVEAARCIRHWHCREPDGMVVSKEAVMRLWDSLSELDQTKSPLNQSI